MLRELQTVSLKNADAHTSAKVAMKVGMAVQKNTSGEAILSASSTGSDVFFVTKERIPTGLFSVQGELSEYTSVFNDIGINERVVLIKPVTGEKYATDQYDEDDLVPNCYLFAGTNGKLQRAWTGSTNLVYRGTYDDNGHTLALVEITDTTSFTDTRNDAITAFSFTGQVGESTIGAGTISVVMPYGTNVTELVATFTASTNATVKVGTTTQVSATTQNNFTNPVTYTVTSADGKTDRDWVVTVTFDDNTEANITAFSFAEQTGEATIGDGTIAIEVANGTVVTGLIGTFTLSYGATAKIGATDQVSGTTANDFTSPVTYVLTAEDGTTTKNWVVTVTVASA